LNKAITLEFDRLFWKKHNNRRKWNSLAQRRRGSSKSKICFQWVCRCCDKKHNTNEPKTIFYMQIQTFFHADAQNVNKKYQGEKSITGK